MGKQESTFVQLQEEPSGKRGRKCVQYRLQRLASKGGGGAFARVVPRETLGAAAFLERVAARQPGFNAVQARFYLEAIFGELAEVLREGNFVNLGGIASFGTSIVGKVAPGQTHLGGQHALRAWARFAPGFTKALNHETHLLPEGGLPVRMEVNRLTATPRRLALGGRFRSPEAAQFAVLPQKGKPIPCEVSDVSTAPNRHECTLFTLIPAQPLPLGNHTLRIRYPAPEGGTAELTLPFALSPDA